MNIVGRIVVAGNVRRSAQIAIGDATDVEYLNAKRWDLGNIPNWRAMSNNSVVCSNTELLPEEFWEGYKGNGEPYGLINLVAARRDGGRLWQRGLDEALVRVAGALDGRAVGPAGGRAGGPVLRRTGPVPVGGGRPGAAHRDVDLLDGLDVPGAAHLSGSNSTESFCISP